MKIGARLIKANRFLPLILALVAILFVLLIHAAGYGFTYQVSRSMPQGFYFIKPVHQLKRGDSVIFHPPTATLTFLVQQGLVPKNGILMKNVMAIPGDYVCKKNHEIWINHRYIAPVYTHGLHHQFLPSNPFCQTLAANQYLLMSTHITHSFDGRYFGSISKTQIIGQAIKV